MSITITCEDCGQRHRLERNIVEPGNIYIVCHSCELPLQAVLEAHADSPERRPAAPALDTSVWAGVLDLTNPAASA